MKGLATVRLLRELERHTGKRIYEMFDLIGTPPWPWGCPHCPMHPASTQQRELTSTCAGCRCRLARLQWALAQVGCWRWRWACASLTWTTAPTSTRCWARRSSPASWQPRTARRRAGWRCGLVGGGSCAGALRCLCLAWFGLLGAVCSLPTTVYRQQDKNRSTAVLPCQRDLVTSCKYLSCGACSLSIAPSRTRPHTCVPWWWATSTMPACMVSEAGSSGQPEATPTWLVVWSQGSASLDVGG